MSKKGPRARYTRIPNNSVARVRGVEKGSNRGIHLVHRGKRYNFKKNLTSKKNSLKYSVYYCQHDCGPSFKWCKTKDFYEISSNLEHTCDKNTNVPPPPDPVPNYGYSDHDSDFNRPPQGTNNPHPPATNFPLPTVFDFHQPQISRHSGRHSTSQISSRVTKKRKRERDKRFKSNISSLNCVYEDNGYVDQKKLVDLYFHIAKDDLINRLLSGGISVFDVKFGNKSARFNNSSSTYLSEDSIKLVYIKENTPPLFYKSCVESNFLLTVIVPHGENSGSVNVSLEIYGFLPLNKVDGYTYNNPTTSDQVSLSTDLQTRNQRANDNGDIMFDDDGFVFGDIYDEQLEQVFRNNQLKVDPFGANFLFYAVGRGDLDLVMMLVLEKGFDIETTDSMGFTPLDIALYLDESGEKEKDRKCIIDFLIRYKEDSQKLKLMMKHKEGSMMVMKMKNSVSKPKKVSVSPVSKDFRNLSQEVKLVEYKGKKDGKDMDFERVPKKKNKDGLTQILGQNDDLIALFGYLDGDYSGLRKCTQCQKESCMINFIPVPGCRHSVVCRSCMIKHFKRELDEDRLMKGSRGFYSLKCPVETCNNCPSDIHFFSMVLGDKKLESGIKDKAARFAM